MPSDRHVLVLSDLHLGPAGVYDFMDTHQDLQQFLTDYAADHPGVHLILNGDTVDLLMFEDPLSPDTALTRIRDILEACPWRALAEGMREIARSGGRVTFRVGNHDLELCRPDVQAAIRAKLGDPDWIEFDTAEVSVVRVGGVDVALAHGEHDDDWNRFPRDVAARPDGDAYPPGSQLVNGALNPAKAAHIRFGDLLKPDMAALTLALLAAPIGLWPTVKLRPVGHMIRRMLARSQGDLYRATDAGAPSRPRWLDELDDEDLEALDLLLHAEEGFALHGRWAGRSKRLLRRVLAAILLSRRRQAHLSRQGEAILHLAPELDEWATARSIEARTAASVVLLGHTHAARFGHFDGLTVLNTGTWTPLIFPPPPEAGEAAWDDFVSRLVRDPGLQDDASRGHVCRRLTAARIAAQDGRADVSLVRWDPVQAQVLRLDGARVRGRHAHAAHRVAPTVSHERGARRWHLLHRCDQLQAELSRWQSVDLEREGAVLTPGDHVALLARAALARLDDARDRGSPAALADAEALWQLYRHADAARRDRRTGRALQWADAIAFDAYHAVYDTLGDAWRQDRVPVPMCVVEPGLGPVTFPRGVTVPSPGILQERRIALPFPVVLLPPDHLDVPGWLTVVLHEVGHDLTHDLGLEPVIADAWRKALGDNRRRDAWLRWLPEILADQLALRLGGPGFTHALEELAADVSVEASTPERGAHPPLTLRLALLDPDRADAIAPNVATYFHDWRDLRAVLWDARLEGRPLRELVPKATSGTWRGLPGDVQLAVRAHPEAERGAAGLVAMRDRAQRLTPLSWVPPQAWWEHHTIRVRRMAPTHLERAGSLFKAPPLHLMIAFDRICFVGETNDALRDRLEQAFVERGRRRWERLDLMFGPRDALDDATRARAEAARKDLEAHLGALADGWATWEHPGGSLYASVWERGTGDDRVLHAHVSARVWGRSIKESPSVDYRSTSPTLADDPELREILAGLRTAFPDARRLGGAGTPAWLTGVSSGDDRQA